MSDDPKKMPDRFTEPPNILIGEERVHDAREGESELFEEKLKAAERQQTQDRKRSLRSYVDELRRKWKI